MKSLFVLFGLFLLLSCSTFAQFTKNAESNLHDNGATWTFTGSLDTLGGADSSLTSKAFSMDDYDGDGNNYFSYEYVFTSATGAPKIYVDLYGSEDNSHFVKLTQIIDTTTSETRAYGAFNLSGVRATHYKLLLQQVAAGRDNSAFEFILKATQKDPPVRRID